MEKARLKKQLLYILENIENGREENMIITTKLTIIIESWSFNVLFFDKIKRKTKR